MYNLHSTQQLPEKNTTVKVTIQSANQFQVTAIQVVNCVAVTTNQFLRPSANTGQHGFSLIST